MVGAVANVPFADVKIVKMSFRFMSNMDIIVQWATILSPIIAVLIAWWTVRSSAKDTAKKISSLEESTREQISALRKTTEEQIAALEENTTKQVESVKDLTQIQIELSILQANAELKKIAARHKSLTQKVYDETKNDMMFNQLGGPYDSFRQKENRRRDLMDENDMALNELKETNELLAQLNNLKKRIGGM